MWRIVLALIVVGIALGIKGGRDVYLSSKCSDEPVKMTATQLEQSGWGDNANVVISEMYLLPNYVYQTGRYKNWEWAFVPAVNARGPEMDAIRKFMNNPANANKEPPMPRKFAAIVKIKAGGEADVERASNRDEFAGIVINSIDSLSSKQMELLRSGYPGANLDGLPILELDREVKPASFGIGFIVVGALLAVAGVGVGGWMVRNR